LPASRRAVPALPWLGKPTGEMPVVLMGETPVVLMGKMPMVLMGETPMLRFHARADMTASVNPAESVAKQWLWTLDPVGNWSTFTANGVTQSCAHNKANEIAGNGGNPIYGTGAANWVDPAYNLAGNMTKGPQSRYETLDARALRFLHGGRIPGSLGQLCRSAAAGAGIAAEIVHLQSLRPGRARPTHRLPSFAKASEGCASYRLLTTTA